jgi:RNA polymerase sigma-70 factor, ECF subfamily
MAARQRKTATNDDRVRTNEQPLAERSDVELVQALVEGDEGALAELYDRHAGALYRAALLRVGDRQLAEEILQDTYLALWNRAELFDPNAGTLRGWLSTIARNRAIDRLRGHGRRPPPVPLSAMLPDGGSGADGETVFDRLVDGDASADDPAGYVDGAWLRSEVERALSDIPEQERDVIRLAYYEELSQSEIAARLNWPLGTVKTRTRRALGRLRVALDGVLAVEGYFAGEKADGPR